jgi:hypothetical protein
MFSIIGKLLIFEIYWIYLFHPGDTLLSFWTSLRPYNACWLFWPPSFVVESPLGVAMKRICVAPEMQVKASRYGFIGLNFDFASKNHDYRSYGYCI